MDCFPLPVAIPAMTVALLWHPRLDADPAHRWLRRCVLAHASRASAPRLIAAASRAWDASAAPERVTGRDRERQRARDR